MPIANNTLDNTNPGKIFIRTDQSGASEPLFKYLDTLIKLLPAYSNKKLCSGVEICKDAEILYARVEHLRQLHNGAKFAVIVQDEKLDTDTEYQFLTNTILEGRAGGKKLADNLSYVYLDKEQSESCLSDHEKFNFKIALDGNEEVEGFRAAEISGKEISDRPNDDHWLRVGTSNLEDGLMNLASYFVKLGKELKIISGREAATYKEAKLRKLAKQAIAFTEEKIDVDCIDNSKNLVGVKREYRNILLRNLDRIVKSTGLIKEDGILYFDEVIGANKWGRLNGKTLNFFPDSAYLQKIIKRSEMTNKNHLKKMFQSLGLRVASQEEEERRYGRILESDWSNISDATGIFRLKEADGFKYYFHLGNTSTAKFPWPKVAGGKGLNAFPGSHIIRKLVARKTIFSLNELKDVWKRIGINVASDEEDKPSVISDYIERNWDILTEGLDIKRIPGKDGELKYFFGSTNNEVKSYKEIASFPSKLFIRRVLDKDSVSNSQELRKVWKRLGLPVATNNEESLEHLRRAIKNNWTELSSNIGVYVLTDAEGKKLCYFRDCETDTGEWGSIDGIPVKDFPSADYIRSVIKKDSITNLEELKMVWKELGIENLADDEEDLSQVRALIENNWEEISSNTGITRAKNSSDDYVYYLNTCKEKVHLWGRVGKCALKDFPSARFIETAIGKWSIESVDDLSKVWKKLGLIIGSNEVAEDLLYKSYQKLLVANIRAIVDSTGIIYKDRKFFFGDCKGASNWCEVNGRPLASFPSNDYVYEIIGRRQMRNIDDLKGVLGSLGINVASEDEEKLRYGEVLENSWESAELTKKTGVERRYDEDEECFKYFFLLAKTASGKRPWSKVAGRRLEHYPGAKIIGSILEDKTHIDTIPELKKVWEELGLRVATEKEEKTELPRRIIEENWAVIKDNLRIMKLPGEELDENGEPIEKYYFSQAKSTAQDWGRIPGYNTVKTFPSSGVILDYIGEATAQSRSSLKKLWQSFGLNVASKKEEQGLAKTLIEMNWNQISANTGIIKRLVQKNRGDEAKVKYFFKFAKGSGAWGPVGDLKTIRTFPNPNFIRSVLSKDKIQSTDDLKKVWQALGIEIATEEEEKDFVVTTLEDSWDSITENTGIVLVPTFNGLTYHFRFARQRPEWGTVEDAHGRSITSYPSGPEVREILGKRRPDSPAELKKLWSHLGLNVASDAEEEDLPRVMIEELNWDYVSKNTGMKRIQSVKGPYVYYFSDVKDPSEWGDMPGIKLIGNEKTPIAKFPELKFIKQVLDPGIDSKRAGIKNKEELAQVWQALGLRVVESEEEALAIARDVNLVRKVVYN